MKTLPLLVTLVWLGVYGQTFVDLWQRWIRWDSEMAHGLPVMAMFFYLLWRDCLRSPWAAGRKGRAVSLLVLAGLSLGWFLSVLINIQIIEQLLLVPLLASALAALYGWHVVWDRRLLLVFPLFAIPIWGSLNDGLLDLASLVVGELVRLMAMPALIQGNSIYLPYGHILIADGCSGIRYFVIALTLGYLIGYLNGYKERRILPILLVAAMLGLLTNWIRIFVLIVIGHYTEMQSGLMEDHELFGWILFAAIALPAIYFAPHASLAPSAIPTSPAPSASPVRMALLALCGLAGPLLLWVYGGHFSRAELLESVHSDPGSSLMKMPMPIRAPAGAFTRIHPLNAQGMIRSDHYWRTSLDDKLVPYLPRLYDHGQWQEVGQTQVRISDIVVAQSLYSEKGGRRLVVQLQWFDVGGQRTASRTWAKLLQVPATLRGRNQFTIITLQAECSAKPCAEEVKHLKVQADRFIRAGISPDQALSVGHQ